MRRYYARLKRGLCPECGGERDGEGIQCRSCRKGNREAQQRGKTKERTNKYMSRLFKSRRAEGMCAYCGREIDESGYRMCSKCRKHVRDYYRRPGVHEKIRLWNKEHYHHEPAPVCEVCGYAHLRCDRCGRFMGVSHGSERCLWICRCGNEKHLKEVSSEAQSNTGAVHS